MKSKFIYALLLVALPLWGENQQHSFTYKVETTGIVSDDGQAPLWLTANRYGLTSSRDCQALLRAGLFYKGYFKHGWQLETGLDVAGGLHLTSDCWLQQVYADISWKALTLSVGSKERPGLPLEKLQSLTSGWMVEGMNTRPVPQIRAEIRDYWSIPGLHHWLALKGHLAFGWFLDGSWQKDFVSPHNYFVRNALYQSKSLMLRLGNKEKLPVELEFGILLGTQFGGEQYLKHTDGTSELTMDMPDGFKAYWKAFFPQSGGADNPSVSEQTNVEGNVLGSWNFALNAYVGDWKIRTTYEHYFEDHSQMFWEYGRWKDGQLGLEVTLPENRWLSAIVWEAMATKDQSGPIEYYDNHSWECLLSGNDNYYNHHLYQSWQYFGLGIGNPLLPGPVYNERHSLVFRSNRVRSHHVGLSGTPSEEFQWRLLASFVRHWGTYEAPLDKQRKQFSSLAEITYQPHWADGWSMSVSMAMDRGNYLGNQMGGMITLRKTGGFGL